MFNLKKAQIKPTEKQIITDNVGPKANDDQPINEKVLPHRDTESPMKPTESQMEIERESSTDMVIEKVLNEAKGYVPHRSDAAEISIPPINYLVEKMRQERISDHWDLDKEDSHWSLKLQEDKQQGQLPKFPNNAPQHDKVVLNNDPRRFKGDKPVPLTGTVTTADVDRIASAIKTGETLEYDTAIFAILREADNERRELTDVEKSTIQDLKIARTKAILKNAKSDQ